MIHNYFAEIQEKLTEIKSLIKDSIVEFRAVSSEMGIIEKAGEGRYVHQDPLFVEWLKLKEQAGPNMRRKNDIL